MMRLVRRLALAVAGAVVAAALPALAADTPPAHNPDKCPCACHAAAGTCACCCHAVPMTDKEMMPPPGQKMDRASATKTVADSTPAVAPHRCPAGCACPCHAGKCTCACHAVPMTDKEMMPAAGQKLELAPPPAAKPAAPKEKSYISSITLLTGYSESNLKYGQDDYKLIPVALRLPLTEWRHGEDSRLRGELFLEPYVGYVTSPDDNYEAGLPIFLRYSVPVASSGLRLFADAGAGPAYMSQRTDEQGSKLNLLGQLGCGVRYACSESLDLELGYRFRYVSNANLKDSNTGIDGHTVFIGFTYRY